MDDTKPKLENIDAFRKALDGYRVSEHARKVLTKSDFLVLSGIAGGGRNTVLNEIAKNDAYAFFVSDTTRPPKYRDGQLEQHGVVYYFRNEADMLRDIEAGEFIEAELIHNQQVSGTSIREFERIVADGKIPIVEAEFGGVNNIAQAKPDAVVIGLLPPSYDEWLRRFRGREEIHEQEFTNRLETAGKVLQNMLDKPYFKFVVNRDVAECAAQIRAIVEHNAYTNELHSEGKQVATEILAEVRRHLGQ